MKVAAIYGSPRKNGNSETLARAVIAPLESSGAEVATYHLNKLVYRGCQSCMACKTKLDHCVLKDDLADVLEEVREADIIVMASPIFFGDLTGQMKCFVDRTYAYLKPDFQTSNDPCRLPRGKRAVIVLTQAASEEMFDDVFPRYKNFFDWFGFAEVHLVRGSDLVDKRAAKARQDLLSQAQTLGEDLAG